MDLVCQIGSTALDRGVPAARGTRRALGRRDAKGRLFPLSRDELVECAALLDAVRRGELDRLAVPRNALDVLAQQIVAEVAAREWPEEALFALVRARLALPRPCGARSSTRCVRMLAEGFARAAAAMARSSTTTP